MDMKNYIEAAEKKAGTQKNLAKILGITTRYINMAKNKERCLSVDTCIVLADYIEKDRLEVIAASNLATEKDEKKRKILESCFRKVAGVATAGIITSILTLAPQQIVKAENFSSEFTKIQACDSINAVLLDQRLTQSGVFFRPQLDGNTSA